MKPHRSILLLLLLFCTTLFAAVPPMEQELWEKYRNSRDSLVSVDLLVRISSRCFDRDHELSIQLAQRAVELAKSTGSLQAEAKALEQLANSYFENANYLESFHLADRLFQISKETGNLEIYANACKVIARHYHFRGEYPLALEFYKKSLKYFEQNKDIVQAGEVMNKIGGVYMGEKDNKNAYLYFTKSLAIQIQLNNVNGMARGFLNIGNVFIEDKKFDRAKKTLDYALLNYNLIHSDEGRGFVYATLTDIFLENNQLDSALACQLIAHECFSKIKRNYNLAQTDLALADIYFRMNDYRHAMAYLEEGIAKGRATEQNHTLASLYELRSKIFEKMGQTAEALEDYKVYKAFSDSVMNINALKKHTQEALKYDQDLENQKIQQEQKARDARQGLFLKASLVGLLLLGMILFLVVRSYRNNRKTAKIIQAQKEQVEQQHQLLKEKNKAVVDSINYAKRLQQAILPSIKHVKSYLPESFIFYKPKDIVAGDFYWMHVSSEHGTQSKESSELILIAAADCTGHGVPGALVSVVCSNALNRASKEFGLTDPGKILDKVTELVLETFEKSGSEVKDGMDISLCAIDPENKLLHWAGANNPLWIAREGELLQTRANKRPVGKFEGQQSFLTHKIQLQKNDVIYLFTDGFADQFGGPRGKKFMYKALKELLLKNAKLAAEEQLKKLRETFEDWKGELEQVDDVCIIGVTV